VGGKIMAIKKQRIIPCLWFDTQALEAVKLYTSVFSNSQVKEKTFATKAAEAVSGVKAGSRLTYLFEIEGQNFLALNGGPLFKFTPAISFLVMCKTIKEVDEIWEKLADGGRALMDLGKYPFSERYGWTADKYGLNWQIMYAGARPFKQKIVPTLMFTRKQWGKAEEAIRFYTSLFHDAAIGDIMRYPEGAKPDEGTIQHAGFTLEGQEFAAMDSAQAHDFNFNEAISFIVECRDQEEIDYYWENLLAGGGEESVCGWLKDKYGVSWQVSPTILDEMLQDRDRAKVEAVTAAFLAMKKFDIETLRKAFNAAPVKKKPVKTGGGK
jgi:predicted 3-demethylubiquinone-9 3-methyltransferase (glyoxalase superfamily)